MNRYRTAALKAAVTVAGFGGLLAFIATADVRWAGVAAAPALALTLAEANRRINRLCRPDAMDAVADAAGVLVEDIDLEAVFCALDADFRALDTCICEPVNRGAVATPRRSCPVHRGGAR